MKATGMSSVRYGTRLGETQNLVREVCKFCFQLRPVKLASDGVCAHRRNPAKNYLYIEIVFVFTGEHADFVLLRKISI